MHLPLLLATLLIPPTASIAAQAEPPKAEATKLFDVVRTWHGAELDHLGIGSSSLGDVNGDGVPDFILGKMTGAYCFYFGPGAARVISGKDGSQLYEVRGTNKEGDCGDAYGDTIAPVGDLDGDGVPDFAVGAWRYEEYVGYVVVYSGKSGAVLATIYGNGKVTRGIGPVPPETCGLFKGSGFGKAIVPLGDLNGDSVPDFAVAGDGTESDLISGASFANLGHIEASVLGPTGDLDGDGHADLACLRLGSGGQSLVIMSSASKKPIGSFLIGKGFNSYSLVGDVDGDGFQDLFVANGAPGNRLDGPEPKTPIPVRLMSGKTGANLFALDLNPGGYAREVYCNPIGDVDGDGHPDIFVQTFMQGVGSRQWIISGSKGTILADDCRPDWTEGRRIVRLGDIDGDGRTEFLLSDFESPAGSRCGGAVHLVRVRPFAN